MIAAFAVGFASFISPCVLPLVPGYLSAVSGVSLDEIRSERPPLSRILGPAAIFCLSFTVLFVALGMSATGIGSMLSTASGAPTRSPPAPPGAHSSASSSVGHGGVLLAFYSAGLAVPFLVSAVAFDRASTAFRWLRDHYVIVTAVSGAVLILMGVLMISNQLTTLNAEAQQLMESVGLDFVYSL